MKFSSVWLFLLLGTFFNNSVYSASAFILDPPGGVIYGVPGSDIGWGFTLTNDSDYLLITSAEFLPQPSSGTFTDYIAQYNTIVVGPPPENPVAIQSFDPLLHSGVGSFLIDPGSIPGTTISGSIRLTYDLFVVSPNDPFFNPDNDTISTGNLIDASASISVMADAVPIPSAIWLFSSILGAFVIFIRRPPV